MSDKTILIIGLAVGVLLLSRRGTAAQNVARYGTPVLNQNPDLWLQQGSFRFLTDVLRQPLSMAVGDWFKGSGGAGVVDPIGSYGINTGLDGITNGISDLFSGATGLNEFAGDMAYA